MYRVHQSSLPIQIPLHVHYGRFLVQQETWLDDWSDDPRLVLIQLKVLEDLQRQDRQDDFAEPRGQTERATRREGNENERERQRKRRGDGPGRGASCHAHALLSYLCFRRDESLRDLHPSAPARREPNRYHYLTVPTYLFQVTA